MAVGQGMIAIWIEDDIDSIGRALVLRSQQHCLVATEIYKGERSVLIANLGIFEKY